VTAKQARLVRGAALVNDLTGVRKMYAVAVPHIGDVALAIAVTLTLVLGAWLGANPREQSPELLLYAAPVVCGDVTRDLTKRFNPAAKLLCAIGLSTAGAFVNDASHPRASRSTKDRQ
jgi:hypothetical protein